METCLKCEINENHMAGNCCKAIYYHAKGRDDDNFWNDNINLVDQCLLEGNTMCHKNIDGSVCAPGLVCKKLGYPNPNPACEKGLPYGQEICYSCQKTGNVSPSGSLVEYYSSTPGGDDSNRHESFSTTASYVGLLGMVIGVTMIVLKTTKKHRRNYQYTEISH